MTKFFITCVMLAVFAGPATAAECPTLAALSQGFQLTGTDGAVTTHQLVDGRMLTETPRGNQLLKSVYVNFQPESFECPSGGQFTYEWEQHPTQQPVLVVGQPRTDRAKVTDCNGKVQAGEHKLTLVGPSSVNIGACKFTTQRIEKTTVMDGVVINEGWFEYQPELRWILKSRFRFPSKPDREFGFTSIRPK